jgi:DNA-nicking Smr family endonuclease
MIKHLRKDKKKLIEELDADERELFLDAYYQGEYATLIRKQIASKKEEQKLFLRAFYESMLGDFFKDKHESESIFKNKNKRARKRHEVDAEIDLHGMYAQDAVKLLLRFIEKEKKRGHRTLLIVHGKGTGILKNTVCSIIESHPSIDDFQVAPAKLGGEGAILVRMNRRNK